MVVLPVPLTPTTRTTPGLPSAPLTREAAVHGRVDQGQQLLAEHVADRGRPGRPRPAAGCAAARPAPGWARRRRRRSAGCPRSPPRCPRRGGRGTAGRAGRGPGRPGSRRAAGAAGPAGDGGASGFSSGGPAGPARPRRASSAAGRGVRRRLGVGRPRDDVGAGARGGSTRPPARPARQQARRARPTPRTAMPMIRKMPVTHGVNPTRAGQRTGPVPARARRAGLAPGPGGVLGRSPSVLSSVGSGLDALAHRVAEPRGAPGPPRRGAEGDVGHHERRPGRGCTSIARRIDEHGGITPEGVKTGIRRPQRSHTPLMVPADRSRRRDRPRWATSPGPADVSRAAGARPRPGSRPASG